jgi:HTH-type transcriptional regulator/antitoxin HipB
VGQDNFFKDLSSVVLYHRKKSKLNRVELARMAGVGKTVVYDIEHGKPTVRLETLLKILTVLNIRIELTGPLMHSYRKVENEKS